MFSYAMYYENLLRHQHQLLYMKEQEVKQLNDQLEESAAATIVDVHCQLADRSHEQLLGKKRKMCYKVWNQGQLITTNKVTNQSTDLPNHHKTSPN